jgi:fatty-acyl-CoA synthase
VLLALGAAKLGVVFVPINTSYRKRELRDIVNRADLDYLFSMDSFRGKDCGPLLDAIAADAGPGKEFPKLRGVASLGAGAPGRMSWDTFWAGADQISDAQLDAAKAEVVPSDPYIIQYTSGTTAHPKGAVLSNAAVLATAGAFGEVMKFGPEDITCVPLPLFHSYGNVLTLLSGMIWGSCSVYLESFRPDATLAALDAERCTGFMGVPTMYLALVAADREAYDLTALTKGGIGGATCPPSTVEAIAYSLDIPQLTTGYGLSEAGALCLISAVDAAPQHRLKTTGFPLPGVEVVIRSRQTGADLPAGETGEIMIRGAGLMGCYYNDPEGTAAAFAEDGWLHTGDLGRQDPDGAFRFAGRIKEIIIRGGENVSPSEIEELLAEFDNVADCQCVGVPDLLYGEAVACCLISRDGSKFDPDEIRAYVAERLAHFKVPKYVLTMDSFPLNAAGKVVKRDLAAAVTASLASEPSPTAAAVAD